MIDEVRKESIKAGIELGAEMMQNMCNSSFYIKRFNAITIIYALMHINLIMLKTIMDVWHIDARQKVRELIDNHFEDFSESIDKEFESN